MLKQILPLLILLSGAQILRAEPAAPAISTSGITLEQCYERARQISETIGISAENYRLLQAQYRAQVGLVLPHLDWIKSQFYQDKGNVAGNTTGATGSSLLTTQPQSYFQLTQPIFGGFRDWSALAISKSQGEQALINQRSADLQLLSDVSAAFYMAYTLQDQLSVLQGTRKLNQDQVDQLARWVNIGRSRPSEVLSAQTQLASLDAQIGDTRRLIGQSRHVLTYLSGVPGDIPLQDDHPASASISLDDALSRAGKRPELLSAAQAVHQAELAIRYAKGGHLPTLGVTGRYFTERVGFLSDVRWDATFLLDVPLYEGGSTQALVRQARSQEIISQLALSRLKRDIDRQVRTAFDDLGQATAEEQAYDKAVKLAEKNYEVQKKEYRTGIINNLELLRLLTDMQTIRRQWLEARANARLDDIHLRLAMGEGL